MYLDKILKVDPVTLRLYLDQFMAMRVMMTAEIKYDRAILLNQLKMCYEIISGDTPTFNCNIIQLYDHMKSMRSMLIISAISDNDNDEFYEMCYATYSKVESIIVDKMQYLVSVEEK